MAPYLSGTFSARDPYATIPTPPSIPARPVSGKSRGTLFGRCPFTEMLGAGHQRKMRSTGLFGARFSENPRKRLRLYRPTVFLNTDVEHGLGAVLPSSAIKGVKAVIAVGTPPGKARRVTRAPLRKAALSGKVAAALITNT